MKRGITKQKGKQMTIGLTFRIVTIRQGLVSCEINWSHNAQHTLGMNMRVQDDAWKSNNAKRLITYLRLSTGSRLRLYLWPLYRGLL